jgi:NADH-quinone oxidoreductase subunit N
MMTARDLTALAPLIVISATALAVMIAAAVRRNHAVAAFLTLGGIAAAFASLWAAAPLAPLPISSSEAGALLIIDRYGLFFMGLILVASAAVAVLAHGYFERQAEHREEFYILLLVAVLGSMTVALSSHFVSFFLGLEILSVALYAMNAYLRDRAISLEAGIKYLILAAASAAFLLFGMALLYAEFGTMSFDYLGARMSAGTYADRTMVVGGMALMMTGFGFKLALAPFHLWTPDIYEGAPAPVTAFVATASKGAMFALLVRYFYATGAYRLHGVFVVLAVIAAASMIAGNLLALLQNNLKRILAYSSIAHMGYVLVAFLAAGDLGPEAVTFYLIAYFITTLAAFGVITVLSPADRDADRLEDVQGLFWKRPVLGGVLTLALLSLAGIPATAGFFAKFYIVAAGASAGIWRLIILLVLTSVVGLFYYLRVLVAVFSRPLDAPQPAPRLPLASAYVLAVLSALLVWVGIFPGAILEAVKTAVRSLRY